MAQWYKDWFDSPFYEILYKDRNYQEAEFFMAKLCKHLHLQPTAETVLDVACGSGRHTRYLHSLGYRVWGIDLAQRAVREAIASVKNDDRIHFEQWDMRQPYKPGFFSTVLNLFTSFGYFEVEEDNQQALDSMAANLAPGGRLVLDYLNPDRTLKTLVPSEIKNVDGITFYLSRKYLNGKIHKVISFDYQGTEHNYTEVVSAIPLHVFRQLFAHAGLRIVQVLGNYELAEYDGENSERLIIVAQKD